MQKHNLKIDAAPFDDLLSGAKTGEVRNDDRAFAVGDTVHLTCNDGRAVDRTISHIQRGYGLPDGICVLSYTRPAAPVEGLETVAQAYINNQGECEQIDWLYFAKPEPDFTELITRSQAEAIIAAKDAEIERLQKINAMIMGDDENAPRYTTKRLKQEVERVTQVMRGEASDREAHVKALEADNAAKAEQIAAFIRVLAHDTADNAAMTARVKELEQVIQHETDCIKAASDKIEALETKLAAANKDINELDNLVAGYHSRLETTETQLAAAVEALEQVATTPLSGWTIAQGIARAALGEVRL